MGMKLGVYIPPGISCYTLQHSHQRAPGADEMEGLVKNMVKEVTNKKISLEQAMIQAIINIVKKRAV